MERALQWEGEVDPGLVTRPRRSRAEKVDVGEETVKKNVAEVNVNSQRSVYLDASEGIESTDADVENSLGTLFWPGDEGNQDNGAGFREKDLKIQNGCSIVENNKQSDIAETQPTSPLVYCRVQVMEKEKIESGKSATEESLPARQEKKWKQEVTEIDLEKIIEEQETHDLYCPNCRSCITKRVILRKRKRLSRVVDKDRKSTATPGNPEQGQAQECSDTQIHIGDPRMVEARTREWDVMKSIVYGGLVESITSLGVVSSAAGSDATTLKIVALGLANLVAGLIVLAGNLKELANDHNGTLESTAEEQSKYYRTLGRRGNLRLHVVVAILCYIIFGIIPPVVYGFSFRKSDNKEYKLIAVAGASFLCILLLSIGKAHVRRAPKSYIKTIFYYISVGVAASGLAYVAGELVRRLLENSGLFDAGAALPPSYLEMRPRKLGWGSS